MDVTTCGLRGSSVDVPPVGGMGPDQRVPLLYASGGLRGVDCPRCLWIIAKNVAAKKRRSL